MSPPSDRVLFREEQRWGAAPAILLVVVGLLTAASLIALPMGWGALIALPMGLLPFWLLGMRMVVEVHADVVVVGFSLARPAMRFIGPHRIRITDVVGGQLGSEVPLGWGYGRTVRRASYRINGHEGVELTMREGQTIFIGSHTPRELLAAIREPRP